MMKSGPPGLPRIISLIIASQLIMDFNNISKCLHSKRRFMFGQLGAVTKGHTEVTHQKTITIPPPPRPRPSGIDGKCHLRLLVFLLSATQATEALCAWEAAGRTGHPAPGQGPRRGGGGQAGGQVAEPAPRACGLVHCASFAAWRFLSEASQETETSM